jgi:transmembrane sensor
VAILAAAVWFIFLRGINDQTYTTAVGEQRSVRLADGSIVYLNTHSSVEIHFSSVARDIQLLDGEALFVVTHDIIRPFRVHADSALIQALGTEFNVYKHGRATTVSVIEGRVRVTSQEHAPQSVAAPIQLLAAGEEAQVSQSDVIKRPTRDPAHTIAWRQRQLVFAGDTLAHVFEQVNRYNQTQITIPDPTVAARRLSGVFNVDDLDSLLQFLNGDGDLAFERHGNELIIRSNVAASP